MPLMFPSPPLPAGTWLLPFSAGVYCLAFGIAGQPRRCHHEWGAPPDPWAVDALAARAAKHAWRPTKPPAYTYRAAVRRLLRSEEARQPGNGDPVLQLDYARYVAKQHAEWRARIRYAEDRLTAAVRHGEVAAFGFPVDTPNAAPANALQVSIPPEVLLPPGRTIRLNGALCWRADEYQDFGPSGCGPYYGDVWVDGAAVRRLLAPEPMPAIGYGPAWAAITWRAFGGLGKFRNLGSRPANLQEPHLASLGRWGEHALRMGAWAALFAAEGELKALLLNKQVTIYGRREGLKPDGQPSFQPAGPHVPISPEIFLNRHWIFEPGGWLHEQPCGGVTAIGGRPVSRQLWFFDVQLDWADLARVWSVEASSDAVAADDTPERTPQPFPDAPTVSPWLMASWRAFKIYDAPPHIVRHRSFDGGTQRLPDEPNATYAARQDDHRRFDGAERELMDLLAAGQVKATGRLPARAASDERLHHAVPGHVEIPSDLFRDRQLAFNPFGELIQRLPMLTRLAPPYHLRDSDTDPRFPLYHDVLIETAELERAWNIPHRDADAPEPTSRAPASTVAQPPPAEYSKPALGAWFVLRVKTWPRDLPPPKEGADHAAAKHFFGREISRDEFREIRQQKTPPEWRKRGPRGSRN